MQKRKVFLFAMITALMMAGCGSAGSSDSADVYEYESYSNGAAMDSESGIYYESTQESYTEESAGGTTASSGESVRAGRKLIRTVSLEVETLEYDELLTYVRNKTDELGGYVESMDAYNGSRYYTSSYSGTGYRNNRSASMTLRIPKDSLDDFLVQVEENSNITSRSEQEKDVTLTYVDLESHKSVLLAEQERLIELMDQAATIEDIITLESRLSDIRYQIESMESQLRTYDNQIEYSTVYLNITEVVELTPVETREQTVWERMADGFMHSLRNIGNGLLEFCIGFVIAIPYLVLAALIALIIVGIILLCVRKAEARAKRKQQAQIAEPVQEQKKES